MKKSIKKNADVMPKIATATVLAFTVNVCIAGWGDLGKTLKQVGVDAAATTVSTALGQQKTQQTNNSRQAAAEQQPKDKADGKQDPFAEQKARIAAREAMPAVSTLVNDVQDGGHLKFLGFKLGSDWTLSKNMRTTAVPGEDGKEQEDSMAALKPLKGITRCDRKLYQAAGSTTAKLVSIKGLQNYEADFSKDSHKDVKALYSAIEKKYSALSGFSSRSIESKRYELEYEIKLGDEIMNLKVYQCGSCSRMVSIELYDAAYRNRVAAQKKQQEEAAQKAKDAAASKEMDDAI